LFYFFIQIINKNRLKKFCKHFFLFLQENLFKMRVVIQRVSEAKVTVKREVISYIGSGLLVLLGIEYSDSDEDIGWLIKKITGLRIFNDENGIMNRSVQEVLGEILVVSQFTLHANTKKGNRPSYIRAANPEFAVPMYEKFIAKMEETLEKKVGTGVFGAMMDISLVNDGPVTIIIDSKQKDF
jgi:D-aminoacyl-tRNA deacylase